MDISQEIKAFASFLNASWDVVVPLLSGREYTSDESSIGNWLQANWEILVERKVLKLYEYLEIYSDGADYNGASSRMNDIEAMPTHNLNVFSNGKAVDILNNETISSKEEFEFDRLVGFQNGFYTNHPPFNYALLIDSSGIERVLSLNEITFKLQRI
ncbi:MAG: hypothetical protein JST23_13660 [Bacteroidetes bacterium]|nr:hypothetical protein [Bacteroidota bacterium]